MAHKGIREYDAKRLMARYGERFFGRPLPLPVALVSSKEELDRLGGDHPWTATAKLVVKPDQLFGKRGKNKLVLLDADLATATRWIGERLGSEATVGASRGELSHFLVEPFVPHTAEYYVAIKSNRDHDTVYLSDRGGINVEENWASVRSVEIPIGTDPAGVDFGSALAALVPSADLPAATGFVAGLYRMYVELDFAYLEINPFAVVDGRAVPLDTVAKLDDTAGFLHREEWAGIDFPPAFGKRPAPEEAYVQQLDAKTGASLKLTILNPEGRIWPLIAGGGASVIYADTVSDLGFGRELAMYGEYSGDPSRELTYEYTKTVLDLMTRSHRPDGKVLLIGGGIANFTDVAKTFAGIVQAVKEFAPRLREHKAKIYVRRGGPNYKAGLAVMRQLGEQIGVPVEVYGPETHMTRIVSIALGNC